MPEGGTMSNEPSCPNSFLCFLPPFEQHPSAVSSVRIKVGKMLSVIDDTFEVTRVCLGIQI